MPQPTRRLAAGLAALAGLLLVAATFLALPVEPFLPAVTLLTHAVHVAAAFCCGLTLLRLPRSAPREPLDLAISATALGLAFLSLATLAAAGAGVARPWTPWVVDAVAVAVGVPRLRGAVERLV